VNPTLRAMRLERWPRSTAVYVGTAALAFLDRGRFAGLGLAEAFGRGAGVFLLTWLISTANYIVNEIADAPFDIHHPTKRMRPLASGEVHRGPLVVWAFVLAASSLAAAWFLFSRPFFFSLLALLAAGFIYNVKPVRAKDIPFLDSVSESVNNPIRFCLGWYAFAPGGFPPASLLLSWWAFGNFLMVAKRLSELRFLRERAGDYRASLRRYTGSSLILGLAASAAVFMAAYFVFAVKFKLQGFLYLSPPLAFYLFLFFRKTLVEKEIMEEPEKLLSRPKYALFTALLAVLYAVVLLVDKVGQ
jgi:4-hydroxybenzoate polyprenyltransferase